MRRRDLVKYVGGATAWLGCVSFAPATVRAQKRVPVVGILLFGGAGDPRDIGFVRELAAIGYVEGRNISYAVYAADGAIDQLPKLAREIVAASPDVIVGSGSPVAHALGEVRSNIPIVMTVVGDPITLGLSNSMSAPSRNFTGFTNSSASLAAKRLELLRDLVPDAHKVAYLWAPESPMTTARGEQARTAAGRLALNWCCCQSCQMRIFLLHLRSQRKNRSRLYSLNLTH
jgi:putative ABC transport system substrate-binding protein